MENSYILTQMAIEENLLVMALSQYLMEEDKEELLNQWDVIKESEEEFIPSNIGLWPHHHPIDRRTLVEEVENIFAKNKEVFFKDIKPVQPKYILFGEMAKTKYSKGWETFTNWVNLPDTFRGGDYQTIKLNPESEESLKDMMKEFDGWIDSVFITEEEFNFLSNDDPENKMKEYFNKSL